MPALAEPTRAALGKPPATEHPAPTLFESGGVSLEDSMLRVWEDLAAGDRAECPVCGGHLRLAGGCDDCGSELS